MKILNKIINYFIPKLDIFEKRDIMLLAEMLINNEECVEFPKVNESSQSNNQFIENNSSYLTLIDSIYEKF